MRMIKKTVSTALSVTLIAGSLSMTAGVVSAKSSLHNETDINQGLLDMAVADKIRRACDKIGGRLFTAQRFANGLKNKARDRGYTEDEIDAYINSKPNRAAMRERRNAYFKSKGASNLDAQSLCVLGRAEISKKSRVGSFLKAK